MALEQHVTFAENNDIPVQLQYAEFLIELICSRPTACAEAMEGSSTLRSLIIRVVHSEFTRQIGYTHATVQDRTSVTIRLYGSPLEDQTSFLQLSMLQSLSVILSIWKGGDDDDDHMSAIHVKYLSDALLHPDNLDQSACVCGLASAMLIDSKEAAMSVESVSGIVRFSL